MAWKFGLQLDQITPAGSPSRLQLLARLTPNAGKHTANQPTRLAHLDDGLEVMRRNSLSCPYQANTAGLAPDSRYNVAQLYARLAEGIRNGKPISPGFDAAVTRHRLLDAIVRASETGMTQVIERL